MGWFIRFSVEIGQKLAAESKKKGITIQAHIRNIIADYYEAKEKN